MGIVLDASISREIASDGDLDRAGDGPTDELHSNFDHFSFKSCILSFRMAKMPRYPGTRQTMEVKIDGRKETHDAGIDSDEWAAQYQAYLDENEVVIEMKGDRNMDVGDVEVEDWAVQYAEHC